MMEMMDEPTTTIQPEKAKKTIKMKYQSENKTSTNEMEKNWRMLQEEELYHVVAVENESLSCSVEEFYNLFLRDEAEYPFHLFQRTIIGDKDIEVSPWRNVDDDSKSFMLTRTVAYNHPVKNAPMAPPTVRATKEQRLRLFGDERACLDTLTTITGVPVSDCFYVGDRLMLEPNPTGGTSISVKFDVCFTKRSIFKKLIKTTTGEEMKKFWKDYLLFIIKNIHNQKIASEPTLMDNFFSGFEEMTAPLKKLTTPFQELAAPLQELANDMVDDFYEAISTIEIPGVMACNGIPGSRSKTPLHSTQNVLRKGQRKSVTNENDENAIEVSYLPTIGREMKTLKDESDRLTLIQGALTKKELFLSKDRLCKGEYVLSEWILNQTIDSQIMGYKSILDYDEAVVAISSTNFCMNKNHNPVEKSFAIEVMLDNYQQ